MRALIEKVAAFIDRYVAVFVVIGMLCLAGLGVEVLRLVENQDAGLHSQLVNRATNVESWCGGINEGRDYDRGFVEQATGGHVAYTLPDKDCEALIRRTLESPKHHGPVTATSNPLTYQVLHGQRGPEPASGTPFVCHPRRPAAAGECIRQELEAEGKTPAEPTSELKGLLPLSAFGQAGIDISVFQAVPSFFQARVAGLRFVLVQTNDGSFSNALFSAQTHAIRAAGLPYGCYAFVRPFSGATQADLSTSMCKGAQGGDWADVEVPGAYRQACSFIDRARQRGFRIVGKYASPGTVEGPACIGYDWPAEWGSSHAVPLPGYSGARTIVRQSCGTCRFSGVAGEVDRDENLGLLQLIHPPPTPAERRARERRELAGHKKVLRHLRLQLAHLRKKLNRYGCARRRHFHERLGRKCRGWFAAGDRVSAHGRYEDKVIAHLKKELA